MKADPANDLLMLYNRDGQSPKAVIPVRDLIVSANHLSDGVAGTYSTVVKKYSKNLPDGIVVYGDHSYTKYKFIGGAVSDPELVKYNVDGISNNWINLDKVALRKVAADLARLEDRVRKLENELQS